MLTCYALQRLLLPHGVYDTTNIKLCQDISKNLFEGGGVEVKKERKSVPFGVYVVCALKSRIDFQNNGGSSTYDGNNDQSD